MGHHLMRTPLYLQHLWSANHPLNQIPKWQILPLFYDLQSFSPMFPITIAGIPYIYIYSIHSHSTICPLPLNRSLDDAVGFLKVELLEEQRNPLSAWRFGITEIPSEVKNVWLKGVQISTYSRYSIWHIYIYIYIYILFVLKNII